MHLKPKQPEKYDGSRDFQKIDNWVASMDSYFAITNAEPPLIYHYLNTIFTDEAATWFRYTYSKTDPSSVTWEQVKAALLGYFVRPNHLRRLRDQWAEARQTGTVTEFYTYLARLTMQLKNISEEEFLDKFIRGLKPNTRTELEFRDPKTIEEAVKWADTFDTRYYRKKDNRRYYGSAFSSTSTYQDDNRGEPMQIDVLQTATDNTSTPVQIDAFKMKSQPFKLKRLSDEERTHLRNIGACFKCRKQGHMARECPSKVINSGNAKRQ
jgi:Ty3 transposon capsid-like protein/Zinc knuckle